MIDDFCVSIFVPSIGDRVQFKQLTNKYYKNILKFIENNDDINLNHYFEYMLDDLCLVNDLTFNRIDKFIIILTLYIVCINANVDIKHTCNVTNREYKSKIDLFEILDKISATALYDNNIAKIDSAISLKLGFPLNLRYSGTGETITSCIKEIIINNQQFAIDSMSDDEKAKIYELIPPTALKKINKYIKSSREELDNVTYMTLNSPFTDDEPEHKTFNIFDNSLFGFICFIFGNALKEYYDTMYIAISKIGVDEKYASENLTPSEITLYMTNYRDELLRQNENQHKDQPQSNYVVDPVAPQQVDLDITLP